jgi:hypothetical protein
MDGQEMLQSKSCEGLIETWKGGVTITTKHIAASPLGVSRVRTLHTVRYDTVLCSL